MSADLVHIGFRDWVSRESWQTVIFPFGTDPDTFTNFLNFTNDVCEATVAQATYERTLVADIGAVGNTGAYAKREHAMRLRFTDVEENALALYFVGPRTSCFQVDTVTVDELDADVANLISFILNNVLGPTGADLSTFNGGERIELLTAAQKLIGSADYFNRSAWAANWRHKHGFDVRVKR